MLLQVNNLSCVREDRTLFEHLSFAVAPGDLVQIEGPNGVGKTSLLRLLTGLSQPFAGEVCWNGENIRHCRDEYHASLLYLGHQPGVKATLVRTDGKVNMVLQRALALMGTPYRWGGTSPDSGFDCSGLVGYVFRTALGIELPRVSRDMASKADAELIGAREELRQGDLVFFGLKGRVNHVGIYVGEGRFLHSPSRGKDVRVDTLLTGYWANRYLSGRRVAM